MRRWIIISMLLLTPALGRASEQKFPAPDFRSGHKLPKTEVSQAPAAAWEYIDAAVLLIGLSVGSYLVYTRRSRRAVFFLMLASLLYFGFYRKGCVCAIGAIQNVALAAAPNGYTLPLSIALIFALPLIFSLFFGRVFCAGVCPLGAIQDVMLFKSVHLPSWLEMGLGLFAWVYLGLGVLYAAMGSDFIICRYDPFIGFFRLSGPAHMIFLGGAILVGSMFVGRIYCRFICPYGVLLRILSPFSRKRVTITPSECVDCRLCETACPFGAIRHPVPAIPPRQREQDRRWLGIALASAPVITIVFALAGWFGGPYLARWDSRVALAQRLHLEESGKVPDTTDETRAFRGVGTPVKDAYDTAQKLQRRFSIGSTILGGVFGASLGLRLIAVIIRRRRTGYTADPGACLACARCYLSCPVEIEHRQKKQEGLVAV